MTTTAILILAPLAGIFTYSALWVLSPAVEPLSAKTQHRFGVIAAWCVATAVVIAGLA